MPTPVPALTHFLFFLRNRGTNFALLTLTTLLLILAPKSTIAQTTPTFGAATMPDTTYTVTTAVSDTLPVATGGTGTLTYTLTPDLPGGLTYKAATSSNGGVIAGTPTTAASATTYTLTATDANNATTTLTFTLSVALSSDATLSRLTFYSVEQAASGAGGQAGGVGGQAGSSDANLRDIQIGDFTYDQLTSSSPFRFTVEAKVTILTVKPTTNDSTATYTIAPADGDRGMAGHQVDLVKPDTYETTSTTTITITVTATNGSTTNTYTIAVTRKGSKNYDGNDNGLIDVKNLAQLNAIRYDLDGNGQVNRSDDANAYADAFPNIGPIPGRYSMGCINPCSGYELLNDLDFDTNGDGLITVADSTYFFDIGTEDSTGFVPIGPRNNDEFTATFQGNGHTISNLFINSATSTTGVGLFHFVNNSGRIESVGLIGAKVTGNNDVGALVGINEGTVVNSYATGTVSTVSGSRRVGGLVGYNYSNGRVIASYSTASVTGSSSVGALVGDNSGTISTSYAIGKVSGSTQGLVGSGSERITHSYYDSETTRVSGRTGAKTTAQLQSPTSYTSTLGNGTNAIYTTWDDQNVDGTLGNDDAWAFGESNQYPVLRYAGHDTTVQFAAQPDKAPNFGTATVWDTTYTANVAVLDTLPAALATSGNGKLTYALAPNLPTGLTFNNMTRVISGTPTTATSARTYTLTVTDADANTAASDTDSLTFTISVYRDQIPTFGTATMPDTTYYTVNATVSDTLPAATGGNGALTYTLTPALPGGLTYNAATSGNGGVIAGTPTTATSANTYTLTVTDADSDPATLTFTIAVTDIVTILDDSLRAVILHSLGKASNDTITVSDMQELTRLDAPNKGITNLTGLEFATNLDTLDLGWERGEGGEWGRVNKNAILDITPLKGLSKLRRLSLYDYGNELTDISALSGLDSLRSLDLRGNSISNIDSLADLTNLTYLGLARNPISNISPLSGLTKLRNLNLQRIGNGFSDISPLRNLTRLEALHLTGNSISDISPLSRLTDLEWLILGGNRITDISHLSDLTDLIWLHLWGNRITDISSLSGLDSLKTLYLGGNRISVIDSLANLTNLTELGLDANRIADLRPLVNNMGLGRGDRVNVRGNPLNALSRTSYIPTLQGKGVTVAFDPDQTPTFGTATVRDTTYTVNMAVSDTLPAATGGNGVLTYTLTPALPGGLTYNAATSGNGGVIAGTPTTATSASTYTLTATDADSDTVTLTFTIAVVADQTPTFGTATMPDTTYYTVNATVSDTLPAATGGNGALTYALTPALPGGLTYNAATSGNGGIIAGKPTTTTPARTYTLTVTDEDANTAASDTDSLTFTIAVRNQPPSNVRVKSWVTAIIVSWDTVTSADGYKVQWKSGTENYDSAARQRTTTTTTDTIRNLTDGTTYTVRVIATYPQALDSAPSVEVTGMPVSLDIDGNGAVKQLADILMIQRYVLFIRGESLTSGSIGIGATRTTHQEIEPYIKTLFDQKILDVDGNGDVELLTDILMITRYVLFIRGESLTSGSIGIGATRRTPQEIATYIASLYPPSSSSKAAISMDAAETAYTLRALAADGDLTSLLFALGVLLPTPDFDGDGQVTFADFLTFSGKFGTRRGEERYDARCDLNGDGEIGFDDFLIFADSFDSAD